jgi:hypothetical protein
LALTAEKACKRYQKLSTEDEQYWQSNLQDIYDYAMPYRQAAGHSGKMASGKTPGAKRTTKIYDATAVMAAPRGAGKLKAAMTPDHESWFLLAPGPLVDKSQATRLAKELEDTTAILRAVFAAGDFSAAADGMYLDLYAGQGAMLVLKGDEEDLVRFVPLSAEKVVLDTDAYGRQRGWFYPIRMECGEIEDRWPGYKKHRDLTKMISDKPETEVELLLHCSREGPRRFTWQVIWKEKSHQLHTEPLRSSPFIVPRFFVVPGERRGRGPLMLAMPHIKTLNKAVEMQLQAGAFALLGAWMTSDDQIYHPRKIALAPGGMVKVKRTGGPLGASLARLPVAENFDLGEIIIDELRMQIKEMLHDEPLPSEAGAVRSPTEIVARLKRLSQDINGAFGRLHTELFRPLIERVLDIMQQWGLVSDNIRIDDYIMKVQVLSPLANSQMLEEVEKTVRFYEILVATAGVEEARIFIDTDAWSVWLHERMGITSLIVRDPEERTRLREISQQMKMAAAAAGIDPSAVANENEAGAMGGAGDLAA